MNIWARVKEKYDPDLDVIPREDKKRFLMEQHADLVREGDYYAAQLLLRFLRKGSISLYLDDISHGVEKILDTVQVSVRYDRRCTAHYTL